MPFHWRRNEWCYNTTSAVATVSAVAIVTVSANAFACYACCERTNGDGREVWV